MPRHRGADPDDAYDLKGDWHVSRHLPGAFPATEQGCPCPKAACGLAAPTRDTPCPQHHGTAPLWQLHHKKDCAAYQRAARRRRLEKP